MGKDHFITNFFKEMIELLNTTIQPAEISNSGEGAAASNELKDGEQNENNSD